jgi:long-chain acyl-CoA synthetase
MVMPTSGSMGDTKCVRISKDNINCVTKSIVKYLMMDNSRISISSLPLNYIYGLSVLNCSLESRSKFVINNSSWIERNFWIDVESNKVTDLSGVPFMFQALKRLNISKKILDNLKCVNQAGGRLEPNLTEFFVNFFQSKNINFYTMYGATEASPRISYVPPEKAKEKIGSVGIPIDIGKVYTDNRDKKSLGEIIYEGKNVCMGYAFTRNELALNDINKGILKTGDIGYIDNDGYLTITGRKKRFVKIYGVSVNLDKIESELKKISEDLAVIGKDDLILILLANSMKNHSDLKNELKNNINFPLRAIKIKNVGTIYKNSSNKLDYAKMNKKYL